MIQVLGGAVMKIKAFVECVCRTILCLVVFAFCSGTARGDDCADDSLKSACTATAISIGATLGPVVMALPFLLSDHAPKDVASVLLIMGVVFGPATGHQYADNGKRMALAMLVRIPMIAVAAHGLAGDGHVNYRYDDYYRMEYSSDADIVGRRAAYVVGALCVATMVYDIMTAGRSAEAYNARLNESKTRVYPYSIAGRQGIRAGLALSF